MNKMIQIVAIGFLTSIGISKAELSTQRLIDKEFLKPLADLVERDADTKLATLYRQKLYTEDHVQSEWTKYKPIEEHRQELINERKKLEEEAEFYQDRYRMNLYKAYQEEQIRNQLSQVNGEIENTDNQLYPFKKQKWALRDLNNRIETLQERKKNPVQAVFGFLTSVNINDVNDLSHTSRSNNLDDNQKTYDQVNARVVSDTDDGYLRHSLSGRYALADDNHLLRTLLASKSSALAQALGIGSAHWRDPIYQAFHTYMQQAKQDPETVNDRIQKLKKLTGPRFSAVEGEPYAFRQLQPTTPIWMSTMWQRGKDYAAGLLNRAGEALRPGFNRSLQRMAPENSGLGRAYEIDRALEESQDLPYMRTNYGVRHDLANRYQQAQQNWANRYQQAQQRWQHQMPQMREKTLKKFDTAEKAAQFFDDYR